MDASTAAPAVAILVGVAMATGVRARRIGDLHRPVLILGIAACAGSVAVAAAGGPWTMSLVGGIALLGYIVARWRIREAGRDPADSAEDGAW